MAENHASKRERWQKLLGKDVCREEGISPATYHRWKQKYGGMEV